MDSNAFRRNHGEYLHNFNRQIFPITQKNKATDTEIKYTLFKVEDIVKTMNRKESKRKSLQRVYLTKDLYTGHMKTPDSIIKRQSSKWEKSSLFTKEYCLN